ncbi:MAG TPA: M20/M25/M40 family metallo-hydrolase [Planctomycetota bacterium]|jgi:membrane-associated protease RseP (regulator of RpoE activity)|nr:M20/M25/M40 family metallo-hydrolase [Planctomycetota bacterium]
MSSRRLLPFLPLLLAAPLALAQESDVERTIALGRSENRSMEHLDFLANRIGPRLTGSHNFRLACEWAREQFEKFGLSNCRLEEWGEFPVGFNRGPSSGVLLAPERKPLHFATNAWTAGTRGRVEGHALLAPTNEEELEAIRPRLKGAWVLLPPASPRGPGAPRREARPVEAATGGGDRERPSDGPQGRPSGPDRAFREKVEKAYEEEGVLGTIRSDRGELVHTGGSSRASWEKLPSRAAITLLAAEHKEISDLLKEGKEVRLEFDVRNWFEKGPVRLQNVIAEIPGTEKPEEVVIVGGHLDSWDGATGTTDNGTGVATTMEAARLLAKAGARPKRTIRFMLWGGEEQGLLGSAAWVRTHKEELPKISAVLVHDEGTNYCAGIPATPPMVEAFEKIFAPVKDLDPETPFKVRPVKGLSGGGSDHASFLRENVPGFFWDQKGRANYNRTHHTQFDTFDAAIPEYQKNSSIVIAVGALGIANLPDLLSRENLRLPGGGFGGRRLGVELADNLTIEGVVEEGLAAKAGLRVGDRLLKIGDRAVAERDEMREALQAAPEKTTVTVQREGREIAVPVELPPPGRGGLAARLGARLADDLALEEVTEDGPAAKAGFKAGDRIVKVNGASISSTGELFQTLFLGAGEKATIVVLRDGKEVSIPFEIPPP